MRAPIVLPFMALLGSLSAFGQAVISLSMPPPGGEGFAALQAGGLFANGAVEAYYNPASLSDLERRSGSLIHLTYAGQSFLPGLNVDDLIHRHMAVAAVWPDRPLGFDLGVALSRSHVDFGDQPVVANLVDKGDEETVHALSAGLRLGLPVSLGVSAKYYTSRIPRVTHEGELDGYATSQGWAFDGGLRIHPRISLPRASRIQSLTAMPAASLALRNLGPDTRFIGMDRPMLLPTALTLGLGLRLDFADLVDLEAGATFEDEVHQASRSWEEPVRVIGFSLNLAGFQGALGRLDDGPGKREETHWGLALNLDLRRQRRLFRRVRQGDFAGPSASLDAGTPVRFLDGLGLPFKLNPRLILGFRQIDASEDSFRDGQRAYHASFSL